jgi:acyl-CoA thioesterase I
MWALKTNMTGKTLTAVVVSLLASLLIVFILLFYLFGSLNQNSNAIRVACVGDSITEGTTYPDDLYALLGSNYSVGNFGVGGASISVESEKLYINQPEFNQAKEFLPKIVIIMLGTNDATKVPTDHILNFTSDYEKLIAEFQALKSEPKIWLVKPPPIFDNGTGLSTPFFVQQIIPRIEQVANETGLPMIDVYTALITHPDYFSDGVHPNVAGAKIIAAEIFNAITQG